MQKEPVVGQIAPYEINYGSVTIAAVHGKDPKTGYDIVDVTLSDRLYDRKTGTVYGSPPGPPSGP